MFTIRRAGDRGRFDHGWLETRHTFSFAGYQDPDHMGFRDLRVINEDWIRAAQGFGTHPHRDMEIITYVVDGALAHRDSMGNAEVLRAGEVQRMSAGRGLTHSEFNHSRSDDIHLLQIWIQPAAKDVEPSWEQKEFPADYKRDTLLPIVTQDGREGSLIMGQDAALFASILTAGRALKYDLNTERHAWVQLISGRLDVNGHALEAGDGIAISQESRLSLTASVESEFLLFDLN